MKNIIRKHAVPKVFRIPVYHFAVAVFKLSIGRRHHNQPDIRIFLLYLLDRSIQRPVPGKQIDIIVFIHNRPFILVVIQIIHNNDHIDLGKIHTLQCLQCIRIRAVLIGEQADRMLHQIIIISAKGSSCQIKAQCILREIVGIFCIFHGNISIRKCTVIHDRITFFRDHFRQPVFSSFIRERIVAQSDNGSYAVILPPGQQLRIQRLDIIKGFRFKFRGYIIRIITGILADIPDYQLYRGYNNHYDKNARNNIVDILFRSGFPSLTRFAAGRTGTGTWFIGSGTFMGCIFCSLSVVWTGRDSFIILQRQEVFLLIRLSDFIFINHSLPPYRPIVSL